MKKGIASLLLVLSFGGFAQKEISAKYDHIGKFNHGLAFVRVADKVGVINMEGKEVIKPEWDKISGFGADGIAYAYKGCNVGLINKDGQLLAEPVYERIGMFRTGKAVVIRNGREGIIDISGKVVVEPKYDKLKIEDGGLVRATENGKQSLLKLEN